MFKYLLIFIFLVSFSNLKAQSHLKFGEWKSYLPYQLDMKKITETKNKIYCSTAFSLFSIDKEDSSIDFMDKVNGLYGVDILDHQYDPFNNQLIIVYKNGSIDILTDGDIYNISDIKNNVSLLGRKIVKNINVANEDFVYLAFDFGLTQLNLQTLEFGFTCFTEFPVNSTIQIENTLYMGTDSGIFSFDLSSNGNPNDILQWTQIFDTPTDKIVKFNNNPYFFSDNYLLELNKMGQIDTVLKNEDIDYNLRFLHSFKDYIILGTMNNEIDRSKVYFINKEHTIKKINPCVSRINDALIDSNGRIWYTDEWNTLRWSEDINYGCYDININSPYSNLCSDIKTMEGKIFVASGGANKINYSDKDVRAGVYVLDNHTWTNYNEWTTPFFSENSHIRSFISVAPSKTENTLYIASFREGVIELNLDDNTTKVWNKETTNYILDGTIGHYIRVRIADMQFDSDNNLWVSNFGSKKPLAVYTKGKDWFSYKLDGGKTQIAEMAIDQNDYIWMKSYNNGIIVYSTNGTIKIPTDYKQINLTTNNSNLPSNNVTALKTDLEGNMWVGTDEGPIVFECTSSVFDGSCTGSRKKTVLEGIVAYVLNEVNVTSIEVDGANRKWIGSTTGLYVLSPSGEEELMHFTVDNSPLFDNTITALGYNGETGEMVIGTNKGILSYKTKTLEGTEKNTEYAYAFPNPVSPDYKGPVAIKGLARDANVKIIDINGQLLFETTALGGQAIWNGNDLNGNRVGSGVYSIISTGANSFEEPEAIAIKVFFIK